MGFRAGGVAVVLPYDGYGILIELGQEAGVAQLADAFHRLAFKRHVRDRFERASTKQRPQAGDGE